MSEAREFNLSDDSPPARISFDLINGEGIEDPDGSFFHPDIITDEELEFKLFGLRDLFTLGEPTELELLIKLFDEIDFLPTEEEIEQFHLYDDTQSAESMLRIRQQFHELLECGVTEFKLRYVVDGIRDTDALVDLYTHSEVLDETLPIRALRLLRSQHSSPVINNAEASLRTLYDPRS